MEMNKLSNSSCDLHQTAMDDHQILHHDQNINDLDSLWPYFSFQPHDLPSSSNTAPLAAEEPEEELGAMKEMMYKIAAMQPVDIDPSTIRKPKRRNVRISDDPQSTAARLRRERISEKIRILQRLVPGGTKMDTASMLDEAIRYVKFLKRQIRVLQSQPSIAAATAAMGSPFTFDKAASGSMEAPAIAPPGW